MDELNEYNFCLLNKGDVIESEIDFESPSEMFTFMNVCLRNGIEFSIGKYCDPIPVIEDAEE